MIDISAKMEISNINDWIIKNLKVMMEVASSYLHQIRRKPSIKLD